jgi:hypothetical protein
VIGQIASPRTATAAGLILGVAWIGLAFLPVWQPAAEIRIAIGGLIPIGLGIGTGLAAVAFAQGASQGGLRFAALFSTAVSTIGLVRLLDLPGVQVGTGVVLFVLLILSALVVVAIGKRV